MTEAFCRLVSWDARTEVHEMWGISVDPQHCQISSRSDKKCARYSSWKNFASRKSRPKFALGHQIANATFAHTSSFTQNLEMFA